MLLSYQLLMMDPQVVEADNGGPWQKPKPKTYAEEISKATVTMSVDVYSVDMEISEVTIELVTEVIA